MGRPDMGANQSRDKTDSAQADTKKKKFQQHAGSDPTLGFEEFKSLYRDISGRQEDQFLNTYVESIFRAFDANKDAQLTFREWQVGFYLLLLLPAGTPAANVSKEDFLLALEIIFRLYDGDGDGVVTDREIRQISRILQEPDFRSKFDDGVLRVLDEVDTTHQREKEGGVN